MYIISKVFRTVMIKKGANSIVMSFCMIMEMLKYDGNDDIFLFTHLPF